jgi:hypothetical protein
MHPKERRKKVHTNAKCNILIMPQTNLTILQQNATTNSCNPKEEKESSLTNLQNATSSYNKSCIPKENPTHKIMQSKG